MYYVKIEFEDTIQSRYKIVVNDSTAKNNEIRRIKTTSPAALDLIVDADWFDKWTTKPKHNDESQKPKQKEKKNKSKNKSKPKRGYESR